MKPSNLLLSILMTFSLLTLSHVAVADGWPGRIVGTWAVNADNFPGNLIITSQLTTGRCPAIAGSIFGDPIQGFYCPFSGRVHFLRKNAASNDTFQVYSANLSQTSIPPGLRMGGLFSNITQSGDGEYSFFASK
jgi:hypothetical protein